MVAYMAPNGIEIEPISSYEMQAEERRRDVARLRRERNGRAAVIMALAVANRKQRLIVHFPAPHSRRVSF